MAAAKVIILAILHDVNWEFLLAGTRIFNVSESQCVCYLMDLLFCL